MVTETRATQPSRRNVLEDLDSRIPTNYYWYLAVLACIGGFLFGYDTANIGSALGFIPYHLSSFWTGYLVAGASLGAGAGALLAGPLTDHFGRKTLLVTDAAIYADRAGDRGRLRDRHRLHRGVRPPRAARPAEHHPAVDDHRRNPGVLPGGRGRPAVAAA
jgi:Sugar (and other) transporter